MLFKNNLFKNAVLALIIANIIWGAAPPIFKWALSDIDPFALGFYRFFFATIIVLPFVYKNILIERRDIVKVALIGIMGITVNISFFFLGLKFAPSINASIIGSAGPIFLIIISVIMLHERPRHKLIYGAVVGLAGVLLIMFKPLFSEEPNLNLLGNSFYFFAMFGALCHTLLGRNLLKKYNPGTLTFWSFFIGAITFLPLSLLEGSTGQILTLTFPAAFGLFYGAILCSAVAYSLLFVALKHMPASETSVFVYLDPIVTVIIAMPLLGEKPDTFYYVGSLLVLVGIYIAEGRLHYHPFHLLRRR